MLHHGQLPCLDVLLAASKLYKVKVFVYFWATNPVIYQLDEYQLTVHLQCVSGIHFNALIELKNYMLPDPQQCCVQTVPKPSPKVSEVAKPSNDIENECEVELADSRVFIAEKLSCCTHAVSSSPLVDVDSGAEISL